MRTDLARLKLTPEMRFLLFHAESGTRGYHTVANHDLPGDRYLAFQESRRSSLEALRRRGLVKKTRDPERPWVLTDKGRRVGGLVIREILKAELGGLDELRIIKKN
jgi:hypothetical protein